MSQWIPMHLFFIWWQKFWWRSKWWKNFCCFPKHAELTKEIMLGREIWGKKLSSSYLPSKARNEDSRQSAYLLPLAYLKATSTHCKNEFWSKVHYTSNLWGRCPLYGCNATDRLISWEIHYRTFHPLSSITTNEEKEFSWIKKTDPPDVFARMSPTPWTSAPVPENNSIKVIYFCWYHVHYTHQQEKHTMISSSPPVFSEQSFLDRFCQNKLAMCLFFYLKSDANIASELA